jgi:aldose 1-epimerase
MKQQFKTYEKDTSVGKVSFYELKSKDVTLLLTSYGAGIVDMIYDDVNLCVRPESIEDFLTSKAYYGKTIGRTSGRLFNSFELNGKTIQLENTPGDTSHLHGGADGFAFKHFKLDSFEQHPTYTSVTLRYVAADGEANYPGELTLDVTYILTAKNEIILKHHATSTKDTLCNITNHVYLNLSTNNNNLDHHFVQINADQYVNVNDTYLPLNKANVEDTVFDFRTMKSVKEGIEVFDKQNKMAYDHAYLLNNDKLAANMYDESSDIGIFVETDYPAMVFYTHNYTEDKKLLDCDTNGVHGSLTVECQYEPSGIYHKDLNSAILRKDEVYEHMVKITPYKKIAK